MLKRLLIITCICSMLCFMPKIKAQEKLPEVSAKSAIVICADNGSVIFSKNEREKRSMASTTKIMTAVLGIESLLSLNKEVKITEEMVKVEGSSMGLKPGNVLTLSSLVKGMMMCSGNDAANSIAIAVSGSAEKFSNLMNEKARQIGMKDTNFVTPSGLDNENHYSTAYDMAILGAYAMDNEIFCDIVSKKRIAVDFIEPKEKHGYNNHNRLLKMCDGCDGIKTGFTEKSGRCLVSSAVRNGIRLIAVTLSAPNDWDDHMKMFDYGFSKVKKVKLKDSSMKVDLPVVGGVIDSLEVYTEDQTDATIKVDTENDIEYTKQLPKFIYAPVKKGQIVGKTVYKLGDDILASSDIIASSDVDSVCKNKNLFNKFLGFLIGIFN